MKMKEKWFQLPLSGYVQRVGFYAFLIHSSTLSEVVFCTTSAYLSPCTRVYVRGISPSGRIFQIPTVWSNMTTQIPKWYLLISFGARCRRHHCRPSPRRWAPASGTREATMFFWLMLGQTWDAYVKSYVDFYRGPYRPVSGRWERNHSSSPNA